MVTATPAPDAASATTLDRSETSATAELYRAAIGSVHADDYLPVFERFEAADRAGPSWNWAAALLTLNWMVFRRLWGAALAYLGLLATAGLLLLGIGRLVFGLSADVQWALLALLVLLAIAVPGVWGHALLYKACRKRMARALAANDTVEQACAMLRKDATTRQRLIGMVVANLALAGTAIVAYLNFPDFHDGPLNTAKMGEARTSVQGQVVIEAPTPQRAASAPQSPASAPDLAASAPVAAASAPAPTASEPVLPALSPAVTVAVTVAPDLAPVSEPVRATPKPEEARPKQSPKQQPKQAAKPAPAANGQYVNAGLFADAGNARRVQDTLTAAGLAAFSQEVTGPRGTFTRVRVGPFKNREEAPAAVQKIRNLGLEAQLLNPQ
jgi:cell division septation protein DedD